MTDKFTCVLCKNTFAFKNDDEWNDEKASIEFVSKFPECIDHHVDRVCDECYEAFNKWFATLTPDQKKAMRNE